MSEQGQLLLNKYYCLPESLQQEVLDFVEFLTDKYKKEKPSQNKGIRTISKEKKRKSNFGSAKGIIVMGDDFDQPLDDFKDYMY